ncbi:RHS repeat domain-containing protein [Psychroflexus sp. MES1-P1E]|uniref:RHS repeat domain-containing protein n=1 Tax=Psychroflexus sp. MES1-P1E TaxID=2058320 RepID=UPI0015E0624F|nr:RHS repeat-associated core domain-containing protein [Psychroflexus sp. MES1-P1E]
MKQKKVVQAVNSSQTKYAGGFIYESSSTGITGSTGLALKFFSSPEGYIDFNNHAVFDFIYQYKDHLGSIRLSYSDSDKNGSINANTDIIEEKNYYPFGLEHKGYNNVVNGTDHLYGFGGKEENTELGLEWLDFGARNYDAALGRWMNLDPLAEMMEGTHLIIMGLAIRCFGLIQMVC